MATDVAKRAHAVGGGVGRAGGVHSEHGERGVRGVAGVGIVEKCGVLSTGYPHGEFSTDLFTLWIVTGV